MTSTTDWTKPMQNAYSLFAGFTLTLFALTTAHAADQGGPDSDPGGPGGGGFGGFGGNEPGYEITWYPSAAVEGQGNKELSVVKNSFSTEVPVWGNDTDMLTMSFSASNMHFSGAAVLPNTKRTFPSDLQSLKLGLNHMHQYGNGRSRMLMLDIESSSDKPFQSTREINLTLGGFYTKPTKNGRDSWMYGAIYSPFGWPNFPIPLVAYQWNPSESLSASIGLPMSLNWKPTDKLKVDLGLNPSGIDAMTTFQASERLSFYGGYQQVQEQYFLADRVNRKDNFFLLEQHFIMGVRRELWQDVALDVSAGYAFDRHFGEGDDRQDLHDRVNLDDSAFVKARLAFSF
jgi:hypothetical protein